VLFGAFDLCALQFLSQKFSWIQTTFLSWFFGFVFMWLVLGNMGVLPFEIVPFAIPLSLLESFIAAFILKKADQVNKEKKSNEL